MNPSCSARRQNVIRVLERLAVAGANRPAGSAAERARPVVLDDRVAAASGCDVNAPALRTPTSLVQRRDERLDDRHGAVVRARVAPAFERMRVRNVPVAQVRGLVGVEAVIDRQCRPSRASRRTSGRRAPCRPG